MKDDFPLVVTLSSIPSSATQGPNADLSFAEGSEEVLEDFEDDLVMKMRVFDFDEDNDGGEQETEVMSMCLLSLAILLFLFFLSSPDTTL